MCDPETCFSPAGLDNNLSLMYWFPAMNTVLVTLAGSSNFEALREGEPQETHVTAFLEDKIRAIRIVWTPPFYFHCPLFFSLHSNSFFIFLLEKYSSFPFILITPPCFTKLSVITTCKWLTLLQTQGEMRLRLKCFCRPKGQIVLTQLILS